MHSTSIQDLCTVWYCKYEYTIHYNRAAADAIVGGARARERAAGGRDPEPSRVALLHVPIARVRESSALRAGATRRSVARARPERRLRALFPHSPPPVRTPPRSAPDRRSRRGRRRPGKHNDRQAENRD